MSGPVSSRIQTLRDPEYTGENRCIPCTVVNAVIAVAFGLLVGVVFLPLGLVVLAGAAACIYLRGYLVPGTPELTERYLPDRIHRAFGDHPAVRTSDTSETVPDDDQEWETLDRIEYEREHSVDPERYMADVGAVAPDRDDRVLRAEFAAAVEERMDHYRATSVGPAAVADIFQVSADGLAVEDREYPAIQVELRVRKWPSEAALLADAATHDVLAAWQDDWLDVPREQRVEILETLRTYLESCPTCGGSLAYHDDTVESCCGRYEVAIYACRDCEARLVEFDPALVESDPDATGMVPDLDHH